MAKRIIQMKDKHHSTTYEYPIVNKDCLGEDVKEYIEAQAGAKIDDTTTSATKVWSSDKTNTEIEKAKDKGIYATITAPTLISLYSYSIAISDLIVNTNIPIQQNDLVIYVDQQNVKAMSIYQITAIIAPTVFLTKLGDFGGGSTLYQHNIILGNSSTITNIIVKIINDSETAMDLTAVATWLNDKGFNAWDKLFGVSGSIVVSSSLYMALYIYNDNGTIKCGYPIDANNTSTTSVTNVKRNDIVTPL